MLSSNLKALLARLWTLINQLDSRLTKSAFAGVGLSIVTGLVIGAFNGCFSPDDKRDDLSPPRAQFAVFASKFACAEDKQLVMEQEMMPRLPDVRGRSPTPDERVQAMVVLADYGRGTRQNTLEMTSLLQGIRPPPQFVNDHQELLDMTDLLRKLVDELDRDLPTNMNLAPSVILADPTLITRLTRAVGDGDCHQYGPRPPRLQPGLQGALPLYDANSPANANQGADYDRLPDHLDTADPANADKSLGHTHHGNGDPYARYYRDTVLVLKVFSTPPNPSLR